MVTIQIGTVAKFQYKLETENRMPDRDIKDRLALIPNIQSDECW